MASMREAADKPCSECGGSGLVAMGCNLFPCPACKGKGAGTGADPETAAGDAREEKDGVQV